MMCFPLPCMSFSHEPLPQDITKMLFITLNHSPIIYELNLTQLARQLLLPDLYLIQLNPQYDVKRKESSYRIILKPEISQKSKGGALSVSARPGWITSSSTISAFWINPGSTSFALDVFPRYYLPRKAPCVHTSQPVGMNRRCSISKSFIQKLDLQLPMVKGIVHPKTKIHPLIIAVVKV